MALTWHSVRDAPAGGGPNARLSLTGGDLSAAATTFELEASPLQLPPEGTAFWITIDNEQIEVTAHAGTTVTACVRGANGTTAATHQAGAYVYLHVVAAQIQEIQANVDGLDTRVTALEGGGGGGASNLSDLPDVTNTAKAAGTGLVWTGATHEYVDLATQAELDAVAADVAAQTLSGLADVDAGAKADGYVLQWNQAAGMHQYVAMGGGGGASNLSDLPDVTNTAKATGTGLVWTGTTHEYVDLATQAELDAVATDITALQNQAQKLNSSGDFGTDVAGTLFTATTGFATDAGTLDVGGNVRMGNDYDLNFGDGTKRIFARESSTILTGTHTVFTVVHSPAPTAETNARYYAASFFVSLQDQNYTNHQVALYSEVSNPNTGYTAAYISGLRATTFRGNGGTATDAVCCEAASYGSSGTFTNHYGFKVWTLQGGTTNYGLYVEDQTSAATNYAIYTNAGLVYFGDNVEIAGTLTAQAGVNVPAGQTYKVNGAQIGLSNGLADAAVSGPSPGHVMIRNASNTAFVNVPISGDATLADTGVLSLANSGVGAGSYRKVTVDAKGRVTAGSNPTYAIILHGAAACPAETGGCADPARVTVGSTPYYAASFSGTAANEAWFYIPLPDNYGGGTLTPTLHYLPTGTGAHRWEIAGYAVAHGGTVDVAASMGATVTINDTPVAANTDRRVTGSAITLGGTAAAKNLAVFRVKRRGDTDAASGAAYLLGIKLEYTPN